MFKPSFLLAGVLLTTAALGVGCSGDGASESSSPASNTPPPIQGLSAERVQSELDGLNCGDTREILDSPDMTEDLYFGTMASYVSGGIGGSEAEWRAVIDWWWQNACGGQ